VKKLTSGNQNILRLIRKGQDSEGWAPVSHIVAQLFAPEIHEPLPRELFEFEVTDAATGRGRARLTDKGNSVVDAMEYL
jgi:hypothetical protein